MTYEEAIQTIPCGRYRHFKGNVYEVIGIARHSEDEFQVSSVADTVAELENAGIPCDRLIPQGRRACPQATLAVEGAINDHRLFRLRMPRNPDHLIFVSFEMAIPPRRDSLYSFFVGHISTTSAFNNRIWL